MKQQLINQTNKMPSKKIRIISTIFGFLLFTFVALFAVRNQSYSNINQTTKLTHLEEVSLQNFLQNEYSVQNSVIHPLPYEYSKPQLNILAESAILIDVLTGDILYSKNENQIIPPASMTKLFAMYVVEKEIESGRFSYNQIISIPEEALACNMPPRSSLMFLGEGQIVTLEELLLGLCICSGNDAAYALAYTVCGSMQAFVQKMNDVAFELGLKNTHFVESSGYSELNSTTPREMAEFCRVYLTTFPDSLKKFHGVKQFTYPKEHNIAVGDVYGPQDFSNGFPRHITMGITQQNTNQLLELLQGCDGLKTGYIDESGYNLSLTAKRNGTRFLSVTMKGPGTSVQEGNKGRIQDGTTLMEYAFNNYCDYDFSSIIKPFFIKNFGSKQKAFNAIPAFNTQGIVIPCSYQNFNQADLTFNIELSHKYFGAVTQGQIVGNIYIYYKSNLLQTIPLISDRTTTKTNFFISFIEKLCYINSKN